MALYVRPLTGDEVRQMEELQRRAAEITARLVAGAGGQPMQRY